MNIFITGISQGIGFALTEIALKNHHAVYGVARNPDKYPALKELESQYSNLKIIKTDLSDELAHQRIESSLTDVKSIDLVINNAGVYEDGDSKEDFINSFIINSYVPYMLSKFLLPKLKVASQPKLVHITSLMGSIQDNSSGGAYAYRASKAALNMLHKCLTIENGWLTCIAVHPGWVQTRMGGTNATTPVHESANGIWQLIEKTKLEESGSFKDFRGRLLPW